MSCDQWKWILSDLMWPLTLFDIRLVSVLSALELIDLMTMMTSSFELILYLFGFRNLMKLSVKIILMTPFGDDKFILEQSTNWRYYVCMQYPLGTRYTAIPYRYSWFVRIRSLLTLVSPLWKSHNSVSTRLNFFLNILIKFFDHNLQAIKWCITTNHNCCRTRWYWSMTISASFEISIKRPLIIFIFCNDWRRLQGEWVSKATSNKKGSLIGGRNRVFCIKPWSWNRK